VIETNWFRIISDADCREENLEPPHKAVILLILAAGPRISKWKYT